MLLYSAWPAMQTAFKADALQQEVAGVEWPQCSRSEIPQVLPKATTEHVSMQAGYKALGIPAGKDEATSSGGEV